MDKVQISITQQRDLVQLFRGFSNYSAAEVRMVFYGFSFSNGLLTWACALTHLMSM